MRKILITLGVIILLISICFAYLYKQSNLSPNNQKLEQFLKDHKAAGEIAEAYKIAYQNPQGVLSKVKCYCGCIKNNGHKNNRHCFINDDGSFNLMGLNCGLCVKTSIVSSQMLAEGKTVQEISDYVDNRWGKGE
ncbi:hypothetical protein HYS91_04240 [Candidatus Daviesbacteria bacterium]|nr:hypothetical protein [Candidatus Daviesbacteria bacterium]